MGLLLNRHGGEVPSPWVRRFAGLVKPGGRVLDLACGSGRHVRWLAAQGFAVTAVDRDAAALQPLRGLPGVAEVIVADLEGAPWPLTGRQFDAVVVTNYLWRPLFPPLRAALAEGGVLLYETFAHGQQTIGRPARPEFLLQPGELLRAFEGLRVVAFEDGFEGGSVGGAEAGSANVAPRYVQRLAAVNAAASAVTPPRYGLGGPGG